MIRILIVDDDPSYRTFARSVLAENEDLEVAGEAGNGVDAITLAAELKPDVIILDLHMPLMDGFQALGGIRTVSPESRVVACSAFEQFGEDALELGADEYVPKSESITEMVTRILRSMAMPPRREAVSEDWLMPYIMLSKARPA